MADCGQSARSATTRGGVDFDDLVTGRVGPYYAFRLAGIRSECTETGREKNLEHTTTNTDQGNALPRATDTLVKWVDDTITDIEIQSEKKVVKFYIGKTYVRKNKRSKVFNAMNATTMRKEGIRSRWSHHKQEDYGKNGLVVLTVVTKDDVPQQSIQAFKHQEMYALALEQQLITHYAFIKGDERLANISTHPGMQQQEESRAIGYPIYMAFALDDSETDVSSAVLEIDVEECYIATDQGGSSAGEETTVTELQDQGLTEEQEEAIYLSASELPASFGQERQETLQQAQNSGSSNECHIYFLDEDTICGIDSAPWDSPEPPMEEASSDDKIVSIDLVHPPTQPHDEHVLMMWAQNERNPAGVSTHHLLSERKRSSSESEMFENSSCQKKQHLENSSSSSSRSKHQLKKSQHLGRIVPNPGDSKGMPIVIVSADESSVGKQMTQLQNQDKQPTSSEAKQKTSDNSNDEKPFVKAHIQGTEVIAQKTFTVTQEQVDLDFESYGFKLHVPEGALPAEVSETQLDVQVSLSGHFQMPSDSRLISAVYWVTSPHKFIKPVSVEIQHCATLTNHKQCSHLTFVHSMHSQKKLPYMFMEQDGGVFTPHSSYGSLSLSHFSGLGIIVKRLFQILFRLQAIDSKPKQQQDIQPVQPALGQAIDSGLVQQQQLSGLPVHTETDCETGQEEEGEVVAQYCAQLYITKLLVNEWKVDLVVTKDLESCLTVVKREYYPHGPQQFSFMFAFKEESISLKIPNDQELQGWKITPYYNPKITRQQVDHFSSGKRIPRCELVLQWCQDPPPPCLQCEIGLLGAHDHSYFLLHVNPGAIMADCGQSARSATTRDGVEFDDLVTGKVSPSYTFRLTRTKSTSKQVVCAPTHSQMDPEHTATTTTGDQDSNVLHRATDTLVKWVDDTITDIEIQSEKKVVKFYIGKTYVRKNKNRKFDAMNHNTWRKSGISSRWHHHRQEDYGKNGMVVLTVVTKEDVPQQSIPAFKHQEMYALALEQQLIIHYAFIRGDKRLANTSTHPGMQQQEESRAIGYPIYMAFTLDDSEMDFSNEVLEGDVNQGGSSAGEETTMTELQDQGLTKEVSYRSASELPTSPFGQERQETLQQAQNGGSSNERHVHFSNKVTICIDSAPWDSPEPPMEASSDNKIPVVNIDLIQPSTQPHDEHVLMWTQNERNPAEVGTPYHLLSERKRPSSESETLENSSCQKKQQLENSSSSSSRSKHQLKKSQHLGRIVPNPGDSKELPIVIVSADESSVGKQMTQLQNQDKQPTSSKASNSTGRH